MLTEDFESYLKDDELFPFRQMSLWSFYSPFILSVENLLLAKKDPSALKIGLQCFYDGENVMSLTRHESFRGESYWTKILMRRALMLNTGILYDHRKVKLIAKWLQLVFLRKSVFGASFSFSVSGPFCCMQICSLQS